MTDSQLNNGDASVVTATAQWSTPLLGKKLLARLLWPLMFLMVLDAVTSYYVTAHYASVAFDRAVAEMAREVLVQVKTSDNGTLYLPVSAEQILLDDTDDQVFYRAMRIGDEVSVGDSDLFIPMHLLGKSSKALMYDTEIGGKVVRAAAVIGNTGDDKSRRVVIAVAETLNKRHRLFSEILAGVLLPQIVLALLVGGFVWAGV
ncbi:MAG TPA: sensor histidine kinase N-terminal domain-containing protein, partial [Rhodocyclaceae bacterium]|nr:sensor histidine kinase N-terminal domain-containing protein [Rhodocyclaceae bacterium]